jgi:hypothetical protein
MIFFANFSFDSVPDESGKSWYGNFNGIVDAKDIEEAANIFKKYLRQAHKRNVFQKIKNIYMDSIHMIKAPPTKPVIVDFSETTQSPAHISCVTPLKGVDEITSFIVGVDEEQKDGQVDIIPFLTFKEKHE